MNKKIILWVVGIFTLLGLASSGHPAKTSVPSNHVVVTRVPIVVPTKVPLPTPSLTPVPTRTPAPKTIIPQTNNTVQPTISTTDQSSTGLSNNNYYTNTDGNQVHSPANSTNGSVPAGATAKCGDGTYSFSQHHSGTCSHHGGVAEWY